MTRPLDHLGEAPTWLERRIDAYLDGALSPVEEAKLLDLLSRRPAGYARLVKDRAWIDALNEPIETPDVSVRVLAEVGGASTPTDDHLVPARLSQPGRSSWRRPAVAIAASFVLLISLQSTPDGAFREYSAPTQVVPIQSSNSSAPADFGVPGSTMVAQYSIVVDESSAALESIDEIEVDPSRVLRAIDVSSPSERNHLPHHLLDDPLRAPFGSAEVPPGLEHMSAFQTGGFL
ncbi:MAG: hypothetical protein ACF8PN_14270 [Phycisphaerales bacterium]